MTAAVVLFLASTLRAEFGAPVLGAAAPIVVNVAPHSPEFALTRRALAFADRASASGAATATRSGWPLPLKLIVVEGSIVAMSSSGNAVPLFAWTTGKLFGWR